MCLPASELDASIVNNHNQAKFNSFFKEARLIQSVYENASANEQFHKINSASTSPSAPAPSFQLQAIISHLADAMEGTRKPAPEGVYFFYGFLLDPYMLVEF